MHPSLIYCSTFTNHPSLFLSVTPETIIAPLGHDENDPGPNNYHNRESLDIFIFIMKVTIDIHLRWSSD